MIHRPGHTPGHISLYLNKSKALIAGDAMVAVESKLQGPRAQVTPDMDTALHSLEKFTQYDIKIVVCYHGGVVSENVNKQLKDLVK